MIIHLFNRWNHFLCIALAVGFGACSSHTNQITIYTSLEGYQLDEFIENIQTHMLNTDCLSSNREILTFNIVKLISSDESSDRLLENTISKDSFQINLHHFDHIFALRSTDLFNLSKSSNSDQKHFIDEEIFLKSFIEHVCDKNLNGATAIAYHVNIEEASHESVDNTNDQIPTFDEEKLYELAYETFGKFAEAQNLLANEKNANITDELIKNTLRLFHSHQSIVQIQNSSASTLIELTIPEYLSRMLRLSQYDQIHYQWDDDIKIKTPWHDNGGELSNQKSTLSGQQRFTGYRKNMILYSDTVNKSIELHADLTESIDIMGNAVLQWQVLIGDIKILTDDTVSLNHQTT